MKHGWTDVKQSFDAVAKEYDQQRKQLIPCFDDFYRIPVSLAEIETESPRILDIGAGTGLFSAFFLQKYPTASLTLIDLSENMLERAKERFSDHADLHCIVADYTEYPFAEQYDLVISSLSIHHLSDEQKRTLYAKAYSLLKPGGQFINADQVLGDTPYLEARNKNVWKSKVEASGLAESEIQRAYERIKLDKMAPLDLQLNWLREGGLSDVECVYKYFNFVVLFGRKVL